ncbi:MULTISPECIES: HhH-GPD-type base excision DNA repair protein [unclassified Luteococcus]|uniref:HhH-GPD-type base excision DNA repair protein n=1 Tax=unclassified Luteococcus TaxID=2639923 RepID=UPI00313C2012
MSDFHLTGDPAADELLATSDDALLIGMCLDQQIPMEKAFSGPAVIAERMGGRLDVAGIAAMDEQDFVALCAQKPAVHRFPGSMGARVHQLCQVLTDEYDASASSVWAEGDGAQVLKRLKGLPGFGDQKARIFLALLGKRRGLQAAGWQQAAGEYAQDGYRSVADITDAESLLKVRETKKAAKAAARAAKDG